MAERKPYTSAKYPKARKLAIVLAADIVGVTQAAKEADVPHQTVTTWMDRPEFSEYRRKAREDLHDGITVVVNLAWQRVAEGLHANTFEPRDVLFAAEKATTQYLLMSGEPTSRTETRSVTDDLNDDEKRRLRDWVDSLPSLGVPTGTPG